MQLDETGVDADILANLALKLAYTVPKITTRQAASKLCLPLQLVAELLEKLRTDNLLEVLGQAGPFNYQYSITDRGRERAARLLEVSGYVGPAPVSLQDYSRQLQRQFDRLPEPSPEDVFEAASVMVLPKEVIEVAGLALLSRRSLFLSGPPGNGKTTLGHLLHSAAKGELWIPYCIGIDDYIIRVFDPQCHQVVTDAGEGNADSLVDRRWIRIKQPFIVVGGELTIEALDLSYSRSVGYYEAPLHFKANGGTFLIDDFGCQRVAPHELLNRWIHPLERRVDFLTLQTGQQIEVPFRQMLIVSTNLDPNKVMSPAFLRRMGYRLYLGNPSPEQYAEIFRKYAADCGVSVAPDLLESLFTRYAAEGRPLRGCEPRDLIERARDVCRFRAKPLELSPQILDVAWTGYFGAWREDGAGSSRISRKAT